MIAALVIAGPQLWACSGPASTKGAKAEPAKVERVEGGLSRVILTEKAAERLDIRTAAVRVAPITQKMQGEVVAAGDGSGQPVARQPSLSTTERKVVPYSSVVYEPHGETWVYTNPERLAFVRERVRIDHIDGDVAVLLEGPRVGTPVVTVGVAELFGIEFGIGK
jgi:hypothetical protein